jgi:hypothetical protein
MQVPESAASTPSSTLKHEGSVKTRGPPSSSSLTAEERNRLTCTLEEIERER